MIIQVLVFLFAARLCRAVQILWPHEFENSDFFGGRMALSRDNSKLLVGDSQNNYGEANAGQVSFFALEGSSFRFKQFFSAPEPQDGARFGMRLAMSGNGQTALVSAPWRDVGDASTVGSVYVFTFSPATGSWYLSQTLLPNTTSGASFGFGLAISDDGSKVLIGAPGMDDEETQRYGGFVFYYKLEQSEFVLKQSFIGTARYKASSEFGWTIAMSGDSNSALIGAYNHDSGGKITNSGLVYYATLSQTTDEWSIRQYFDAGQSVQTNAQFGLSIALSYDGKSALVGAPGQNEGEDVLSSGAVFGFTLLTPNWTASQTLLPEFPSGGAKYGQSTWISSNGGIAAIGSRMGITATSVKRAGTALCAVSIFTVSPGDSQWALSKTWQMTNESDSLFGTYAMGSHDGSLLLVGSPGKQNDQNGRKVGAVYAFCTRNSSCPLDKCPKTGSTCCPSSCTASTAAVSSDITTSAVSSGVATIAALCSLLLAGISVALLLLL